MSSLEVGQFLRGVVTDLKGIIRSTNEFDYPKPNMTHDDTISLNDGRSFSSESEKERLISEGQKVNTKKRYSPTFSKQIEQFRNWKNSITEKLKRAIPIENTQYEALSEHVCEKPVQAPVHGPAEQDMHALQSIRDRKQVYTSSERREADRILDNASALEKSQETLSARAGNMSPKELKHFEKDVSYQRSMSEKWNEDLTKLYERIEKREKAELKKAKKKLAKQTEQKKTETKQQLERHHLLLESSQKQLDRIRAFQESSLKSKASGFNAQEYEQMNSLLERGNALKLDREAVIHHLLVGNTSKAEAAQLTLQNQSRQWEQEVGRFHQTSLNPHKDILIDPKNPLQTGLEEKVKTGSAAKSAPPQKARSTTTITDRLTALQGTLREEAHGTEPKVQKLEKLLAQGELDTKDSVAARLELKLVRTHRGTRKDINECIDMALAKENPKPRHLKRYEKLVQEHLSAQKEWNRVADSIIEAADQRSKAKALEELMRKRKMEQNNE